MSIVALGLWFWWLTDVFSLLRIGFFAKISPEIWASIIALMGVVLTIRNASKQTFEKLDHDSKQRDRDRDMRLRREIYLNATAAITQWQNLIGKLSNLEFPQSKMDEELGMISAVLSKVSVVGTNETIQVVSRLTSELLNLYLGFLSRRIPLMNRKIEIDVIGNSIQQCLEKQKQNLQIIEQVNLENDVFRQKTYRIAKDNLDYWTKKLEEHFKAQDELMDEQNEEHQKFTSILCEQSRRIADFSTPALFAIRKELGFFINEREYKSTIDNVSKRADDTLKSFFEEVKKSAGSK